ncbi:hypothetical protein V8E55_002977 [Tylopilus felleus]
MLRLSRLSRRARPSLNFRYTIPGHANPHFLDRTRFIDPTHPAANLYLRNVPLFVSPQFTIRAFPNTILHEPIDFVPVNPLLATGLVRARSRSHAQRKWWSNLSFDEEEGHRQSDNVVDTTRQHDRFIAARQLADARVAAFAACGRHNVSLLFHTSKKLTSKSCVIRRRLRSKMTAAISLVVARNADAIHAPESDKQARPILSSPTLSRSPQDSEPLTLQGWTYLVMPNLTIYKMPLPNLVKAVREALLSLNKQSKRLEAAWATMPKRRPRASSSPPIDNRARHPHKVVDKSQSMIRKQTQRPCRFHHTSEHAQGSDTRHEPAKKQSISTCLYSVKPVILPHERLKNQK